MWIVPKGRGRSCRRSACPTLVQVETIKPAEREVIANQEDNAQLHNVVVLRAVICVLRVADCRTELVPNTVSGPELEEVIEAVEHQAVVDCKTELVPNKDNEPEVEEVIEAVEHQAVVDVRRTVHSCAEILTRLQDTPNPTRL